jgi:hypothetical protein
MVLPQVLQFWDIPDIPSGQAVSFGLSPSQEKEMITWRMDLPGALSSANQILKQSEQQILISEQALENVSGRAETLATQIINRGTGNLSFEFTGESSAEAELFELLNQLSPNTGGVTFDISERSTTNWQEAHKLFESSLGRLNRVFIQYAAVETKIQGSLIGNTIVSWSGNYQTSWQSGVDPGYIHLHQRSLKIAMASRRLFLSMFSVSVMSAARLSVLLSIPGGALLTLPAIWKFVTRIVSEIDKYQRLNQ